MEEIEAVVLIFAALGIDDFIRQPPRFLSPRWTLPRCSLSRSSVPFRAKGDLREERYETTTIGVRPVVITSPETAVLHWPHRRRNR